jgi:hypothetical protein
VADVAITKESAGPPYGFVQPGGNVIDREECGQQLAGHHIALGTPVGESYDGLAPGHKLALPIRFRN